MPYPEPVATSDEALAAYRRAHREQDLEGVLAMVDFEGEAMLELSQRPDRDRQPIDLEVSEIAAARKGELIKHYATYGFATGPNVANCRIVTKFEDSPDQHVFVLQDSPDSHSVNTFRVVFQRTSRGWLLIRSH